MTDEELIDESRTVRSQSDTQRRQDVIHVQRTLTSRTFRSSVTSRSARATHVTVLRADATQCFGKCQQRNESDPQWSSNLRTVVASYVHSL